MNFLLVFFASYLIKSNDCLILKGKLNIPNKLWKFVGKFSFISNGKVNFHLSYPLSYSPQNLLFYYDDQWPLIYPEVSSMTCGDKESFLTVPQIFNLTTSFNECKINCTCTTSCECKTIECFADRSFSLARPRWWFIVLSRCYPDEYIFPGLNLDYYFEFTNGNDAFHKHFSSDEFGIFETSIGMFLYYFIISLVCTAYARILYKKMFFHATFRLFIISVYCEFISFIFMLSEYAQFSSSGISTPGMITVAMLFDSTSQTLFLLMLILLAKGYNVTRGKLRKITIIKICVLFSAYLFAIFFTFIYAQLFFDPGLVNYFYQSPAGLAQVIIKLVFGWGWFFYSTIFTIKNYPEKRSFYAILFVFFSLWFWSGPIVILCCNYLVVDHVRQFVGYITQSLIIAIGHSYFLYLTRPTKENDAFPYHIRTNQINPGDLDNYPHHNENQGGNINFDSNIALTGLFSSENSVKYRADNETVSE